MMKINNLEQLCEKSSSKIIEAKIFVEILEDMVDGERKMYTLLSLVKKNLIQVFNDIEECRSLISNSY